MKKTVIIIGVSLFFACLLYIKNEPIKNAFAKELVANCMGEACPKRETNGQWEYKITRCDDGDIDCCKDWDSFERHCEESMGE